MSELNFLTHEIGSLAKPPWLVKTSQGRVLRIADLVNDDPSKRDHVSAALKDISQLGLPSGYTRGAALPTSVEGFLYPATYTFRLASVATLVATSSRALPSCAAKLSGVGRPELTAVLKQDGPEIDRAPRLC